MKKRKKRKRGVASRQQKTRNLEAPHFADFNWRRKENKLQRLKQVEEETQSIFDKVIETYTLTSEEKVELEREWKLALDVIYYFEDATPDELLQDLPIDDYEGTTLSELVEFWDDLSESYWRVSYDLSNAMGLATLKIDDEGIVSGERVGY